MIKLGEKCKVYIETPDGSMLEVPAIAYSIQMDSHDFGLARAHIELEALGGLEWLSSDEWEKTLAARKAASEWKCGYCGRPNQRADETCKSCGAVRSFVYG